MSAEQVRELAGNPLFSLGVHAVDHPFLTRGEQEEVERQIADNKEWLERVSKRECDAIAYPLGDYEVGVLQPATYSNRDVWLNSLQGF